MAAAAAALGSGDDAALAAARALRAKTHEDLWRNTAAKADDWPLSAGMLGKCVADEVSGKLGPMRFAQGQGPLGSAAMHARTEAGRLVFGTARQVMEAFVRELAAGLEADASWQERAVFWCPEFTFHSVVTVFMEVPAVLDNPADKERCREVSIEEEGKLAEALQAGLAEVPAPKLRVEGYRITPDGALIVLFEEADGGAFSALRRRAGQVGAEVLGELTSRPKNIIHATIGRVLLLPEELPAARREAAAQVVRSWSQALGAGQWPASLNSGAAATGATEEGAAASAALAPAADPPAADAGRTLPGLGAELSIPRIVLYRETGWWLTDFFETEIPLAADAAC